MQTTQIHMTREKARELFRQYRAHRAYSAPIDQEIQRTYQLIAQGRVVIQALDSIKRAGVGQDALPKLAIARATEPNCWLTDIRNGGCRMQTKLSSWSSNDTRHRRHHIDFPADSFPGLDPRGRWTIMSMVPIVPIHLRPKRGLENYHILYEAVWRKEVPVDPLLLRRIGEGDLWVVVAAWDLTTVEQAALAARLNA